MTWTCRCGRANEGRWCAMCGLYDWQAAEERKLDALAADKSSQIARLIFYYLGFAVDMHARWLAGPWLTRAICACHPDLRLAP